ncbi:oxysterol-binding protein-related protein 1-like [Patiria miniata]|uniref:Oxysterol-binding protein n=1 Tax=Patiria miniata TaxID=46514 RepID=A0A913ZL02_PATMI|nr:oxysterol-binding protein-related protein 1-like [Patiria miniata]
MDPDENALSDSSSEPTSPLLFSSNEERLLYASRHGDSQTVRQLLRQNNEGAIQLNIDCKGTTKANLGWSPLHLAAYFGHVEVATLLLSYNADFDIVNTNGDTPLHRAAFTGRLELVAALIQYGADVTIVNGEGHMARDIAHGDDIQKMLIATEQAQKLKLEQQLLASSAEGLLDHVQTLLFGPRPPNINCADVTGNTPLHCASYRDQHEVVMLLLQHGANPRLPNKKGHTPIDLAQSQHMKQLLNVKPVKVVQSVDKREGPLLKTRFTGSLKQYWVVLDRGILTYYRKRADAVAGIKRVGFRYLDHAEFKTSTTNSNAFAIQYSNNTVHTWLLDPECTKVSREDWLNALEDHRAYSDHYTMASTVDDDYDDVSEEFLPLGSIADSLKTAQARQRVLEQSAESFQKLVDRCLSKKAKDQASALEYMESLPEVRRQLAWLTDASKSLCSTLGQCLASMMQQEELRKVELSQALEKSRVLQDGLQALALEHHDLEQISRYSSFSGTFYDAKTEASCAGSPESLSDRASLELTGSLSDSDSFHSIMDGVTGSLDRLHVADPEGQRSDLKKDGPEEETKPMANGVTDIVIPGCSRTKLPAVMIRRDQFSLWTVLKQCIGKELSKITMPVVFNEPLSFLQRFCEYTEHCQLLYKAAMSDDPVERMKYVATFAMAAGASNLDRLSKPFNPLLGETYELVRDDMDMKIVLEQVSHHPPVSAFHCTSPYFEFHGSIYPKLKFWGKSLEVLPKGVVTVTIPKYNETYTWHNPSSCLHNLIVGKLWIEMYGLLEMTNHRTGHKCFLHFKPAGWFGKDLHKVEGYITNKNDEKIVMLFGKWTEYLYAMDPENYDGARKEEKKRHHRHGLGHGSGSPSDHVTYDMPLNPEGEEFNNAQLLWHNTARPDNSTQYYNFTLFAIRLNELTEQMKTHLPPTDARFRPDIRCMENGDIDSASDEKHRLEEKQRATRKHRSKSKETWSPLWFKLDINPNTGEQDWVLKGNYWDRKYTKCPDIF